MDQNKSQMIQVGQGYLGPALVNEEAVSSLADKIMQMYDKRHEGVLGNTAIASIMMDMYKSLNKEFGPKKYDLDTYSKVMDLDKDGRVSRRDIEGLIRKYLKADVEISTRNVTVRRSRYIQRSTLDQLNNDNNNQ